MACSEINSILVLVLVMLALLGLAVWISPRGCRWLSLRLYCRAAALEAARTAFAETLRANVEDGGGSL